MYAEKKYGFWMTLRWSRKPLIYGFIYSLAISALIYFLDFTIILPWQPVSVIGIAVAFYLGFKNNSSYDRTWEARKIWGSIVNNSRSFGAAVTAFVQGENAAEIKRELIYRHVAWLTALRYQLRLDRPWEHDSREFDWIHETEASESYQKRIREELLNFLSKEEVSTICSKTNRATQILKNQSERLQELRNNETFEDFRHMEFHHLMVSFYEDQGKSERIKNFPFPRQYASTATWLTMVFCALVPFALDGIFGEIGGWVFWLGPFISALIIWVFALMEMIGEYSENPFEGTFNDVPITNISRAIEIDLREMINDSNIPEPTKPINGFLM